MGYKAITSTDRGLISTFGQYSNRSSSSFSGIFGTATYPQRSLSSLNVNYYVPGNPLIWINIATSNFTKGYARILYPWTEQSTSTSLIGHDRQAYTGTYTYISIACTVNYGYTFNGWWTLPNGGSVVSYSNTLNLDANACLSYTTLYAQFL